MEAKREPPDWKVLWSEQVDERMRFVCVRQKDWKILYLFFKHPKFKAGDERYLRQMIDPFEEDNAALLNYEKKQMLYRMREEMRELDAPEYLATFKRIADAVQQRAFPGAKREYWPDIGELEYQLYEAVRWEDYRGPYVSHHHFTLTPEEQETLVKTMNETHCWFTWNNAAQDWQFLHWHAWFKLYREWEAKKLREYREYMMGY